MFHLRELERKDLSQINRWRNDPELIALLGAPFRYINLDVDVKWYESYMGNRGKAVRCAITEDDSDEILGLVSLVSVDYMNQSAEFHIMIGESGNQGRGIGTFAVKSMLRHAFLNMNLQRVELSVLDTNERAKHVYEKCGFVYEGRKRKARYKDGKFVDLLLYSILRTDFSGGREFPALSNYLVDEVKNADEMDCVIRLCDDAFQKAADVPISKRSMYAGLLSKVYTKGHFFLAYRKELLGYCAFYANDLEKRAGYINLIAVRPMYQKAHLGSALLNQALDAMRNYGMESCVLEVRKTNASAIHFYRAHGFYRISETETSFYMKKVL